MDPVKAPLDVAQLTREFQELGPPRGFRVERFGTIAGHPLLALTKRTPGPRPRIYLSAGIHGDEPAGPLALRRLLERGFFDDRAVWFLCPLLNPLGLVRGTRENADGIDLNRDYRLPRSAEATAHVRWLERQPPFDLTLCLHEDWESKGFYLYELNPNQHLTLAERMIVAVGSSCLIDTGDVIDGRPAKGGVIRPEDDPAKRDPWPEAIFLRAHHAGLHYTLETPSSFPLEQRVMAHCAAVETAVAALLTA